MTQKDFGKKIKEIRISMNMTQIKFADLLGWKDSQSVAQIESGKTPFPPDRVIALCGIARDLSVDTIIDYLADIQKQKIREKVYSVYKSNK